MYLKSLLVITTTILSVLFMFPFSTEAISESAIFMKISPENPAPGENVNISLSSYTANLDTVLIMWSLNGSTTSSGNGKKTFSTRVGEVGSTTSIVATIFLPDGEIEKRVTLRPSSLTLLWQAHDSYTPPFYRGKALPGADTDIKVVAMPELQNTINYTSHKNLTYEWKKDYNNDQEASGYGNNYIIYTNDYLERVNTIGVTATTIDQKYSSSGQVSIPSFKPKLSFYRVDSKLGTLFNKEISGTHFINEQDVIRAVPYFMSPKNIQVPTLVFRWYINDNLMNISNLYKTKIPLKVGEGISGKSKLRLEIEDSTRIFQTASKEINVEF